MTKIIFIYEVTEISKSPKLPYFNHGGVTTTGHRVALLQEARDCAQDPREEKDKGKESQVREKCIGESVKHKCASKHTPCNL